MSKTDRPGAMLPGRLWRRPLWLPLFGLCMTCTAAQAQFPMPGMSPWSGLGGPMGQAGLPSMSSLYPGMSPPGMSPWSGLGGPLGQAGLPSMSSLYPGMSPPGMSPWSGFGGPLGQAGLPSMSSPYPGMSPPVASPWSGFPSASPVYPAVPQGLAGPYLGGPYGAYPSRGPAAGSPGLGAADSYQPDLTGKWRGSGGERVVIQGNRARIWGEGGGQQSCSCVFFLVGQRLIAYSPDSDRVRKYWFKKVSGDRFALLDDAGNPMVFWRVR